MNKTVAVIGFGVYLASSAREAYKQIYGVCFASTRVKTIYKAPNWIQNWSQGVFGLQLRQTKKLAPSVQAFFLNMLTTFNNNGFVDKRQNFFNIIQAAILVNQHYCIL